MKELKLNTGGNAWLLENDEMCYFLLSYKTLVCYYDGNELYYTGTYSQTTRRHITLFLRKINVNTKYYCRKCEIANATKISVEEMINYYFKIKGDE